MVMSVSLHSRKYPRWVCSFSALPMQSCRWARRSFHPFDQQSSEGISRSKDRTRSSHVSEDTVERHASHSESSLFCSFARCTLPQKIKSTTIRLCWQGSNVRELLFYVHCNRSDTTKWTSMFVRTRRKRLSSSSSSQQWWVTSSCGPFISPVDKRPRAVWLSRFSQTEVKMVGRSPSSWIERDSSSSSADNPDARGGEALETTFADRHDVR